MPADARDAGRFCGLPYRRGQLMLMMLAMIAGSVKKEPADNHDAGRVCRLAKRKQLMLMMLAVLFAFHQEGAS